MGRRLFLASGTALLGILAAGTGGMAYLLKELNRIQGKESGLLSPGDKQVQNNLFRTYPGLAGKIPWTPIGNFPTPVEELGSSLGLPSGKLWVKRDDLTSPLYGGNKVRKLEYLMEDARIRKRNNLITIGGLGSNHALATAIHGSKLGFQVHLCLTDQPVSDYVLRNLAGFLATGARIHYCQNTTNAYKYSRRLFRELKNKGEAPYFILSGGTCGLSNLGHLSAALELAEQVRAGIVPEPKKLFVAVGTCGTISGLIAGLKISGLSTRVTGVRVVDSFPAYPFIIRYYAQKVADHLHRSDPSVPKIRVNTDDFDLLTDYLGAGYGSPTSEGKAAVELATSHIDLETTYTGKTLAACLDYIKAAPGEEKVLFWNSYNSAGFKQLQSFDLLPGEIRRLLPAKVDFP